MIVTGTMAPTAGAFPNGIWQYGAGALVPLVTFSQGTPLGAPAPGTNAMFGGDNGVRLDDSGRVMVGAWLKGNGVTSSNDIGIWGGTAGSLGLIAREGDVAPDTGGKAFAEVFGDFVLNGHGQTAFHGKLAGVPAGTEEGIWGGSFSSPRLWIRAGDLAPGLGSDAFLHFYVPALNDNGSLAFIADLDNRWGDVTASNEESVYAGPHDALRLVAREGWQAPGLASGTQFAGFGGNLQVYRDSLDRYDTFRGIWLADDGRLVIPAGLRGPGVTSANDASYWAYVPGRGLVMMFRTGEPLPGTVAGTRVLARILVAPGATGADGRTTPFNNAGEFAFRAEFTDGSSGLFVASLPTSTSWPAPTFASLAPSSGVGGTVVAIEGTNFLPSARVTFGGIAADPVTFVSSTQLTASVPYGGVGGVSVVVTNPNGQATAALPFTYQAVGTPFVDDPLHPRATRVRAVHITELRQRIGVLREALLMNAFSWTDPTLVAGVTRVKAAHLMDLRTALREIYEAIGFTPPVYTDATISAGTTIIKTSQIAELRAAVVALETYGGSARRQ